MPPVIAIRPATTHDAVHLAPNLRAADRDEIDALSGRNPRDILIESVEMSSEAWAGMADDDIVCLFGVAPLTLIGVTAAPWLMGSTDIEKHQRAFLRRNRQFIDRWQAEYPVLRNVVDARNAVSIRWLRWLGFTVGAPAPMGVAGLPFIPFAMEAKSV